MHQELSPRTRRLLTLGTGALTAVAVVLPARGGTFTWEGGTGEWWDDASWVGGVAPTRSTDVVQIDGGNPIASVVTNYNAISGVGAMIIDAGDTLRVGDDCVMSVGGPLTVNGSVEALTGSWLNLRSSSELTPTTLTINGTGRVILRELAELGTLWPLDTLQLGPGLLVQAAGPSTIIGQWNSPLGDVINAGTIQAGGDVPPATPGDAGQLEVMNALRNTGTLRATNRGLFSIGTSLTNAAGALIEAGAGGEFNLTGPVVNDGTIRVTAPGLVAFGGQATNRGTIDIAAGAYLVVAGGNLHSPAGLDLPLGNLGGNGTVTADVRLGGQVIPGYGDVGSLTIAGNLTLTGGAHYVAELSGTAGADLLQIQGNLDLSATGDVLDLQDLGGLNPGDPFVIVTYTGTLTGAFDQVTPGFLVSYDTPGEIAVTVVPEPASIGGALAGAILLCRRLRGKSRQPQQR